MCLITKQKKVEILKEDLTVYKRFTIIDEQILPWSYEYRHLINYKVGQLHKQPLNVNKVPGNVFDSIVSKYYNLSCPLKDCKKALKLTHIHEGFHSVIEYDRLESIHHYLPPLRLDYICIIPKGSEVFKDKT